MSYFLAKPKDVPSANNDLGELSHNDKICDPFGLGTAGVFCVLETLQTHKYASTIS
jgi:hypothetical protein